MDVPSAVKSVLSEACSDMDETTMDYVSDMVSSVVETKPSSLKDELKEEVAPFLADYVGDNANQLCDKLAELILGGKKEGPPEVKKGDYVVNLEGIILAYGTRSLLQQTNLKFRCGQRYVLVGQNGVGKTTLMSRMAAKNITGFPTHLRCVYVRHEILLEKDISAREFLKQCSKDITEKELEEALDNVGFTEELKSKFVSKLSGGWRMRLAIAEAVMRKAHILLLDEPTNHLDTSAVAWLSAYLKSLDHTTVVFVSHDADFIEDVATDIVLFDSRQLTYFPPPFSEFLKKQNETRQGRETLVSLHLNKGKSEGAGMILEEIAQIPKFKFPPPGPLDGEGSKNMSRTRAILQLKGANFRYPGATHDTLHDVSCKVTLSSRVGISGLNGAGKSTMLGLMVGELEPTSGSMMKHFNLRIAYVAQHSMHHLEEHLDTCPLFYFQKRFKRGIDEEAESKVVCSLSSEERELMTKRGNIEEISGRHWRGRQLEYEVRYVGFKEPVWCPLSVLQTKGEYAKKLVKLYDEQMAADAAGLGVRPLTTDEVLQHLDDFGLNKELSMGKIGALSGGQRCRLVLAAAMWNRPHVIAFDEPTNYLDREALQMLENSIQDYRGGVIIVSHNDAFIKRLCNERWRMSHGKVTCERIGADEHGDGSAVLDYFRDDEEGEENEEEEDTNTTAAAAAATAATTTKEDN